MHAARAKLGDYRTEPRVFVPRFWPRCISSKKLIHTYIHTCLLNWSLVGFGLKTQISVLVLTKVFREFQSVPYGHYFNILLIEIKLQNYLVCFSHLLSINQSVRWCLFLKVIVLT